MFQTQSMLRGLRALTRAYVITLFDDAEVTAMSPKTAKTYGSRDERSAVVRKHLGGTANTPADVSTGADLLGFS